MHHHHHPHQLAFTSIQHPGLPAPVMKRSPDSSDVLPPFIQQRPMRLLSFTPVAARSVATHKSFTSTRRRRWGALHVCIAWQIYYNEQLKKIPKPSSLHQEPLDPAPRQPDSGSDQPSYLANGNTSETGTTSPSDAPTSLSASYYSKTTDRKKPDWDKPIQPPNLNWEEQLDQKAKHRHHQLDTSSHTKEHSWDYAVVMPDSRGSHGRKRQRECGTFLPVKKLKQEDADDLRGCQAARAPTGLYPGAELVPSWELQRSDHISRQLLGGPLLKEVIRMPYTAQGHSDFCFSASHVHFPLAVRQQEAIYLSPRTAMAACNENLHRSKHHCCHHWDTSGHLPHPHLLATSYLLP